MKELPLSEVYRLLEPGPVVLLTTAHKGRHNVMTMSWHMMVEFTPPLVACVVSNGDYSFEALRKTKECVIAVPSVELAEQVVEVGNSSGRDTDKFVTFGLTPEEASSVEAPLVAECFAISSAASPTHGSSTATTFSFSKWSRHGRRCAVTSRERSTIAAMETSSSTARRSG